MVGKVSWCNGPVVQLCQSSTVIVAEPFCCGDSCFRFCTKQSTTETKGSNRFIWLFVEAVIAGSLLASVPDLCSLIFPIEKYFDCFIPPLFYSLRCDCLLPFLLSIVCRWSILIAGSESTVLRFESLLLSAHNALLHRISSEAGVHDWFAPALQCSSQVFNWVLQLQLLLFSSVQFCFTCHSSSLGAAAAATGGRL